MTAPLIIIPGQSRAPQRHFAAEDAPSLDLARRHFEHKVRDLRVIGTWLHVPGAYAGAVADPCLVLLPVNESRAKRATPCVIPLSSAWRWAEPPTGDPIWCAMEARKFCELLGKDGGNDKHVWQVMVTVLDRIGDLLAIPPEPPAPTRVVGIVKGWIGTHYIEQEIRDRA